MSHLLEQYGQLASFASLREPAWHGLGTVFDEPVDTMTMLRLAHMADWDVRLEPVLTRGRYHKEGYEVIRNSPFEPGEIDTLGFVGGRYNVFQNEELFAFGDNLLHGGIWETAGSIKNGTVVFGSLRLNEDSVLDPNGAADKVERYLLLHSSHDGTTQLSASVVGLRVVCNNTLTFALSNVEQSFKIRHTGSMDGKVEEARHALNLASAYFDEFDAQMEKLIQQTVTMDEAMAIVRKVYPEPDNDSKAAMTRWENTMDQIDSIYKSDTVANIFGTKWGIVNAMTERLDWFRTPRKGDAENLLVAASGFDEPTTKHKQKILAAALA